MDRHLNIFDFFNNHDSEFYEDNLSRGFALCLKYDTVLLDNVLRRILNEKTYSELFNTDYPDYQINIDLQKRPADLENFSRIVAVACSASEIDIDKIQNIEPGRTSNPETDLCLEINDTCIIFEFKRTGEDCSAQLKCQAEIVKGNSPIDVEIIYIDFNWKKIVKVLLNVLSLQRQINSENQFTVDFVRFIEKHHPDWFPNRLLQNISYPKTDDEPNQYYLNVRLNQIKAQVAKIICAEVKEYSGRYYRLVLSVDWGWANEVHIDSHCEKSENYITILIYPGDTKGQGRHLFKPNRQAIIWPAEIQGFKLEAVPFIKFSHFNSGLFWYFPEEPEYKKTHNREYFKKTCGRYQKYQWAAFENNMNIIAPNWKQNREYSQKITDSNRTYFDLSFGVRLRLYIPYKKAQELDNNEFDSKLAKELSGIIIEMQKLIDEQ